MNRQENRHEEESQEVASKETAERTLWLASVIRQNLYEFVIGDGMKALDTMLEQDRERLCGAARDAVRWGSTDGRLVMAGRPSSCESPAVAGAAEK